MTAPGSRNGVGVAVGVAGTGVALGTTVGLGGGVSEAGAALGADSVAGAVQPATRIVAIHRKKKNSFMLTSLFSSPPVGIGSPLTVLFNHELSN
jgi:hypothetical protein